jgi:hypothetical protein
MVAGDSWWRAIRYPPAFSTVLMRGEPARIQVNVVVIVKHND